MNNEKTNKIISSEELDDVLPKYEPIKLSGINLAQNYVSAFNTGMNIYQCVNYLQGNIDWTIKAVNDVVKSWNTEVSESIDQSKAIVRETTTEQFNVEWTNKQPELIEQVNTLTTNQINENMDTKANKADVLSLEEIQASTDLTGKIASASALMNVKYIQGEILYNGTSGKDASIRLKNTLLSYAYIMFVSEDGIGFASPINNDNVRNSSRKSGNLPNAHIFSDGYLITCYSNIYLVVGFKEVNHD